MHEPRNDFPIGPMPTGDEIELRIHRARAIRAEATAAFFGSAARGIAKLARKLARRLDRTPVAGEARAKIEQVTASAGPHNAVKARLGARRERRRVHRELMAHSDRELEELGIARTDIPQIARSRGAAATEIHAR